LRSFSFPQGTAHFVAGHLHLNKLITARACFCWRIVPEGALRGGVRHSTVGWSGWQLIQFVAIAIAIVVIAKRAPRLQGACVWPMSSSLNKPCFAAFVQKVMPF
jgi:hypothetical protein